MASSGAASSGDESVASSGEAVVVCDAASSGVGFCAAASAGCRRGGCFCEDAASSCEGGTAPAAAPSFRSFRFFELPTSSGFRREGTAPAAGDAISSASGVLVPSARESLGIRRSSESAKPRDAPPSSCAGCQL